MVFDFVFFFFVGNVIKAKKAVVLERSLFYQCNLPSSGLVIAPPPVSF